MGISNTNYNSSSLSTLTWKRAMLRSGNEVSPLEQILMDTSYSVEEDLLTRTPYKTISKLKDSCEGGIYATVGTVVNIETRFGWWYKGCKSCFHALKEEASTYHCISCDTYPTIHVPREMLYETTKEEYPILAKNTELMSSTTDSVPVLKAKRAETCNVEDGDDVDSVTKPKRYLRTIEVGKKMMDNYN
ncbi:hypothetical protein PIB30_096982 [Stylosanthes scabra]|uniref:Replication factor A C-terminal domain-containing protein n=1 Tax=Stylosanthes scabra TaxID=79078 RepID=A0ABU6TVT5_9FABA|nr:hypothetical protein [Stylosanthes scabra]